MKSVPLGRRVSAVVALLVPVAVLVELVAVLLRRPLILAAAAVCFSLGVGAAAYAVTRMRVGRFRWPMWLVFPAALTCAEMLRNFGPLGGFPWGNVGTSFATVPLLLQAAALFGVQIPHLVPERRQRCLIVALAALHE